MKDDATNLDGPAASATNAPNLPAAVDRATFQAELDRLRVREKAHTREGDAIAAARRRLPMVEVDANLALVGPKGALTLLDAFEGRRQLIAYYFMWDPGRPAPEQCEGCTFYTTHVAELSYLHSRDITYATFCQGPYDESARYRDFMGWDMPWYSAQASLDALLVGRQVGLFHLVCYLRDGERVFETYWTTRRGVEAMDYSYALMDLTVYGRQEPGRTRPPAGHNGARTRGLTLARPIGHRCQCGRADAPSPSGRDSKLGALTTCGRRQHEAEPPRPTGNVELIRQEGRFVAMTRLRYQLVGAIPGGTTATTAAALTATLGAAAACWVIAIDQMRGMDMGVATRLGSFAFFAASWVSMMAAMMLPGAVPALLRAPTPAGACSPRRCSRCRTSPSGRSWAWRCMRCTGPMGPSPLASS